jgi:hypothetical protein
VQAFVLGQAASHLLTRLPGSDVRLAGGVALVEAARQSESWASRVRVGGSVGQLHEYQVPFHLDAGGWMKWRRSLAFTDAAISFSQRGDATRLTESFTGSVTMGQTHDARFQRGLVSAAATLSASGLPGVSGNVTYGRTSKDTPDFELFSLGGSPPILIDRALLSQRIAMPVLPSRAATGTSALTYRVALATQGLSWYWWTGRTAQWAQWFDTWNRVRGVEWTTSFPPIAPIGTPAARIQIGLGESLDEPLRKKWRGYFNLVLNP